MELVCPAGGTLNSIECAIRGGADAVYLGFRFDKNLINYSDPFLSSMPDIHNYPVKQLGFIVKKIKKAGKKVYVTINSIFNNSSLEYAYHLVKLLSNENIDGIIAGDMGFIYQVSKEFPHVPIHAGIMSHSVNSEDAWVLKKLGVQRIVFERVLSFDEVKKIKGKTGIETEIFGFGQYCFSYFSYCNISSYLKGESLCQHPCIGGFSLCQEGKQIQKGHLLHSKNLNLIDYIPQMMEADVDALKIEGRGRSERVNEYIIRTFRDAIDHYAENIGSYPFSRKPMYFIFDPFKETTTGFYMKRPGKESIQIKSSLVSRLKFYFPYLNFRIILKKIFIKLKNRLTDENRSSTS